MADTLYQQALKLGDKKAQCLAYIIPLQFYISQKDDSKIEKASTDLKEISRANNYLQYYYHAWSSEIIYFLNQQRSLLALQKAEKMKKQAFADRYPYGIFSCIRTMGHIYKSRGNFDLSAQYYQEALDYMLKNMPDQDPSQLYSSLAEYYRNTQKDYATALDYCEKALKSAKTERNIAQAMIEKCLVLFRQGRIDEFNDCYKEAVQMADRCKLSASVSLLIAHISKNILDKQYEQAHAHADQLSEKGLQQHAYIYECAKDYPNAIKYLKKIPPAVGFDEQSPATVGHRRTEHPDRRRTSEKWKTYRPPRATASLFSALSPAFCCYPCFSCMLSSTANVKSTSNYATERGTFRSARPSRSSQQGKEHLPAEHESRNTDTAQLYRGLLTTHHFPRREPFPRGKAGFLPSHTAQFRPPPYTGGGHPQRSRVGKQQIHHEDSAAQLQQALPGKP